MAAIDLCGTADVYSFLQKPVTDTSGTAITASLITRASRLILNWTGREFAPGTTATRSFWYQGGGWLTFSPYDLQTAGTVQIDTETSSPTTLVADTDYFLEPLPNPNGVYEAFRFARGIDTCDEPRQVTVSGTWGFAAVPDDVTQACVLTVGTWLRRDVHAFTATFNVDEARLERPESLPSGVKGMLNHYRRAGVG